jgi:cell division protein FtsA
MAKGNVIVGLDIGTSKTAVAVGAVTEAGGVDLIGFGLSGNSGMRKGQIIDMEECTSSVSAALEEAERTSGVPLTEAVVNVSGPHINILESKGVVAVARADGDITSSDVERAVDAARAVSVPRNQEVLHIIPREFIVDGQGGIKDPTGMNGVRLETSVLLVTAMPTIMKSLARVASQAGIEPVGFYFSPLAAARTLLTKKQKELGVVLLDFGAGLTELTIFEEGELIHAAVLPVGSLHITNDIAIGLRTTWDVAEKIKLEYAQAGIQGIRETETIRLEEFDPNEEKKVLKKEVAEIVEARLQEIVGLIKKELRQIGKDGLLPAGVVLTGGGCQLKGLVDYVKENLRLPAIIGEAVTEVGGMVDKLDNPRYTQSVGLMLVNLEQKIETRAGRLSGLKVSGAVERARDFLKQFLP